MHYNATWKQKVTLDAKDILLGTGQVLGKLCLFLEFFSKYFRFVFRWHDSIKDISILVAGWTLGSQAYKKEIDQNVVEKLRRWWKEAN